jgi:hypothetical protein
VETFKAYVPIAGTTDNQRLIGHGGGIAGGNTNWSIYLDTEWVGVILANYDLFESSRSSARNGRRSSGALSRVRVWSIAN